MGVPQVVIVGRPNVGKSSILNWLVGQRVAVVDDQPGVTRDRLSQLVYEDERYFELVDTGGMGIDDVDNLTEHIEQQITTAIESAHVILFVVDTLTGLLPLDEEVAKRLRYVDTPVICVANKTDNPSVSPQADEFYKLGRGKLVRVSVKQNRGRRDLVREIIARLPSEEDLAREDVAQPEMKVAIVGRRNVGKSTFVNTLAEAKRMIVSEVPGTTRDSVDVKFELDGKRFIAIDTPGLRRTKSVKTDIDFYGTHRAKRSVRRADVVLLFFDCAQRISKVDKQLCEYIAGQYKPCIFVVNKWDQYAGTMPTEKWVHYLRDTFRTMPYVPIAFITGETGKNVKALLNHAQMLFKQSRSRETTGDLNRVVRAALEFNPPPMVHHRRPKVFYATQVGVQPPTVVLFCNKPDWFAAPYRRFLLGWLRDHLAFGEVPIKLYLRKRGKDDTQDEIDTHMTSRRNAKKSETGEKAETA
ncbi:MAG: ribosome biogenesis GTPase Der [Pirellulales bacterium]|nr:ribosome biogenesis GTPase Der [Pirellulales bacterium]